MGEADFSLLLVCIEQKNPFFITVAAEISCDNEERDLYCGNEDCDSDTNFSPF